MLKITPGDLAIDLRKKLMDTETAIAYLRDRGQPVPDEAHEIASILRRAIVVEEALAELKPARCAYCGLTFTPDRNHTEHLCWENLASAKQAVETWKMECENLRTKLREELEDAQEEIS